MLRLFVLMFAYLVLLTGSLWMFRHNRPDGALAYAIAIAPAIPIIGVFWAVIRLLVEETDEYLRLLLVRQCMFATGFCLTVVTIREFLQDFELIAADNGGFGAAFFWFVGLGLGVLFNKLTVGDTGAGC